MQDLLIALYHAVEIYSYVLIARILCSWLPNVDWYKQPFRLLNALTEPVLAPFRKLIPPLGGIDFSPIVLFFALNLLQSALGSIIKGGI